MLSFTEENYLKGLFQLTLEKGNKLGAGTNELAAQLKVKPATTNDMLKKLKEKKLIEYEKYGKSSLTKEGKKKAIEVIRKHRLWETFLFEKLSFSWHEVHEVAEQLEHIQSGKLIDKLDEFLNFPAFDPHGDVIPDKKGAMILLSKRTLDEEEIGHECTMIGVKDNSAAFLKYVDQVGLGIKKKIKLIAKQPYDEQMEIEVNGLKTIVSKKFASNILIICKTCS